MKAVFFKNQDDFRNWLEKAWDFFQRQAPSYKKTRYYWIMNGVQEKTKAGRLASLINASEEGRKV